MTGAGDLFYRVICRKRENVEDGFGNTVGDLVSQFSCNAAYRHKRGNEEVLAARLQGVHPIEIVVRANSLTKQITTDWQIVDARNGTEYAVRDVAPTPDRAWYILLCEGGVAS